MTYSPSNPLWKGPLVDGISQSMLQKFAACPYRFYLYAILGLKDNTPLHPNLIWGDCFHKGLEHYLRDKDVHNAIDKMLEYAATKYPGVPSTYETSLTRCLYNYDTSRVKLCDWTTELLFDSVYSVSGRDVRLRGKLDGITHNHPDYGSCLIEHKTKGYIDPTQTRKELAYDLQLNFYMQLHQLEWVIYDLILIPEAQQYLPAKPNHETPQAWMERLFVGPCGKYGKFPINSNKPLWQHQAPYQLPPEEQAEYWDFVITPWIERLCIWYEHVTQPDFDHLNPAWYNHLFYRVPPRLFNGSFTEKFQCEYYSHLIGQENLEDLAPVSSLFNELEEL